jgi:hypothetical protein
VGEGVGISALDAKPECLAGGEELCEGQLAAAPGERFAREALGSFEVPRAEREARTDAVGEEPEDGDAHALDAVVSFGPEGIVVLASQREVFAALGPFVGILLGMLSGCMWPLQVVPDAVAAFGRLFPTAWALDAYLALVFGRASWQAVLPQAGALVLAAAACAAVGVLRLRRELGRG